MASETSMEDRLAEYDKLLERLEKVKHIEKIPSVNKMIEDVHHIILQCSSQEVNQLFTKENNARSCRIFRQQLDRRLSDPSASSSEFLQTYTRFTSTFRDIARQYNEKVGEVLPESGVFERILRELAQDRLINARFVEKVEYGQYGSEACLLRDYYVIMTNCFSIDRLRKSDAIAQAFVRESGFAKLVPYLQACNYIQISTIFFLSMMVTDDTKETLNKLTSQENLQLAVAKLREGISSEFDSKRRRHSKEGFNVALLLERCYDLMHSSVDCAQSMLDLGLLDCAETIITALDVIQRPEEEHLRGDSQGFATVQELIGALKCYLTLCFNQTALQRIKESQAILQSIQAYSREHANSEVRFLCANILLQIEGDKVLLENSKDRQNPSSRRGSAQSKQLQVMISYNWAHQSLALRIRDALKEKGANVWIDVDCMRGNIVEMMATGVESSDVVVMLFSRGYHQSSPCQSEANFAYKLKKRIVPVKVEGYEPTGWLGLMLAGLLYYDLSEESQVESGIGRVVREVLNKKVKSPSPPPSINERQHNSHSHVTMTSNHANANANSVSAELHAKITQWSAQDVADWVSKLRCPELSQKLSDYDGLQLCSLLKIRRESLQLFLSFIEKYDLPNGEVLRLIAALDKLEI